MKILNSEDQLSTHDNTKIHEAVSKFIVSTSYRCHYTTSGSDNLSSHLIILMLLKRILVFSKNIYDVLNEKWSCKSDIFSLIMT